MFLFRKQKKLTHKQTALIGFVLAVMSLLVTLLVVYGFPVFTAWLYASGVYALDLFLLGFVVVLFLSLQALILFGFPLYYAQDKKCHMTGFRILLYALGWMLVLVFLVSCLAVAMSEPKQMNYSLEDFDLGTIEDVEEAQPSQESME